MAEECKQGGSLFYVRAYGPSIITGKVSDNGDGTYRAIFYPTDPGRYTVEVVLEFSEKPEFDTFPVGVMIPNWRTRAGCCLDFPCKLLSRRPRETTVTMVTTPRLLPPPTIGPGATLTTSLRPTQTVAGPKADGRSWTMSGPSIIVKLPPDGNGVSYLGYQHGLNSLGVKLKYENNDCRVLTYARANRDAEGAHLVDRCLSGLGIANSPNQSIRFMLCL